MASEAVPSQTTTSTDQQPSKVRKFTEYSDVWATASALLKGTLSCHDSLIKSVQPISEKHLLVVGGKSAGKSSIISRYLEKKSDDKDTIGVNYSTWKRQRDDSLVTDLGNIWEMGCSSFMKEMLDAVLPSIDRQRLMVLLVVDISKLETMAGVLGYTLKILNDSLENFSVIPVWIIGNKFDRQPELNLELDKRQAVADFLRRLAATYSFGLIYTSHKNNIDPRLKNICDSWFLEEPIADYPIVTDAIKLIYVPPVPGQSKNNFPITPDDSDQWRQALNAVVPQKQPVEFRASKESVDSKLYAEPDLDEAFSVMSGEIKAKTRSVLQMQKPRM